MQKIKKFTETVTLKMEKPKHKELERVCKKLNISVSEFIRVSVELSIKKI